MDTEQALEGIEALLSALEAANADNARVLIHLTNIRGQVSSIRGAERTRASMERPGE